VPVTDALALLFILTEASFNMIKRMPDEEFQQLSDEEKRPQWNRELDAMKSRRTEISSSSTVANSDPDIPTIDRKSAVCPQSATMNHDKAIVIRHRRGQQMPNLSQHGPL
jgi:hypothetical protein